MGAFSAGLKKESTVDWTTEYRLLVPARGNCIMCGNPATHIHRDELSRGLGVRLWCLPCVERTMTGNDPAEPIVAEVVTVPTLFECIQYIAGYDADRAREQNGVGFNSNDTDLGNELARKDYEHWFNWQREWAFRKIHFYKRQLTEGGLRWDLVPEPTLRKMPDPIKKVSIVDNSYHVEFAHLGPDFEPVRAAISQIPGRYFDAKGGFWRIPMDSLGARGLRQFATAHDFTLTDTVVESLYKVVDRGPLMAAGSRAVKPFGDVALPEVDSLITPWPHQQAGRQYARLAGYRMLISDEMGCIDGGAFIKVNRAGATRTWSLAALYSKFNGTSWNAKIPTYVKSLTEDGLLKLNRVLAVLDKGVKPVVKVTLADGKSVRCTIDHPIATQGAGFIAARSLKVGELVLTNGQPICLTCGDGGRAGTGGQIAFRPRPSAVVSVEPDGEAHVYDIQMADPDHNFVANGIVVHNTGKTLLTLLAAQDAGVFEKDDQGRHGMLVICPASVKINWARECANVLPGKTVRILKGSGLQSVKADILIANYDIMKVSLGPDFDEDGMPQGDLGKLLKQLKRKMYVLDECHYIKEPDAQRTLAIRQLIKAVNPPFRIMLSGSPILNRVGEFATALDFAGMLDSFGGAYRFLSHYGGRDRSRLKEMNEKLREAGNLCRLKEHHVFTPDGKFIHIKDIPEWVAPMELRRRLADEVEDQLMVERLRIHLQRQGHELVEGAMKLPEKIRSVETLELSNRNEYDRALAEFRAWLWEMIQLSGGDIHAFNRAMKAEALVKLNKLRQLVGRGKVTDTISWVKNFMESSEEKLVLFVEHDYPQDEIEAAFPGCAIISGGQSSETRQRNIDRFQTDPDCRLIISKTKAGGIGITLTAASHVAILELPWNPGTLDQAEDRLHRGGQTKNVTVHYLLAENTIDQKMSALIDEKREIVSAAIHGGDVESDSMLSSMLEDLAA